MNELQAAHAERADLADLVNKGGKNARAKVFQFIAKNCDGQPAVSNGTFLNFFTPTKSLSPPKMKIIVNAIRAWQAADVMPIATEDADDHLGVGEDEWLCYDISYRHELLNTPDKIEWYGEERGVEVDALVSMLRLYKDKRQVTRLMSRPWCPGQEPGETPPKGLWPFERELVNLLPPHGDLNRAVGRLAFNGLELHEAVSIASGADAQRPERDPSVSLFCHNLYEYIESPLCCLPLSQPRADGANLTRWVRNNIGTAEWISEWTGGRVPVHAVRSKNNRKKLLAGALAWHAAEVARHAVKADEEWLEEVDVALRAANERAADDLELMEMLRSHFIAGWLKYSHAVFDNDHLEPAWLSTRNGKEFTRALSAGATEAEAMRAGKRTGGWENPHPVQDSRLMRLVKRQVRPHGFGWCPPCPLVYRRSTWSWLEEKPLTPEEFWP